MTNNEKENEYRVNSSHKSHGYHIYNINIIQNSIPVGLNMISPFLCDGLRYVR